MKAFVAALVDAVDGGADRRSCATIDPAFNQLLIIDRWIAD
jgi:hypothetical protein